MWSSCHSQTSPMRSSPAATKLVRALFLGWSQSGVGLPVLASRCPSKLLRAPPACLRTVVGGKIRGIGGRGVYPALEIPSCVDGARRLPVSPGAFPGPFGPMHRKRLHFAVKGGDAISESNDRPNISSVQRRRGPQYSECAGCTD